MTGKHAGGNEQGVETGERGREGVATCLILEYGGETGIQSRLREVFLELNLLVCMWRDIYRVIPVCVWSVWSGVVWSRGVQAPAELCLLGLSSWLGTSRVRTDTQTSREE